MLWAKEHSLKNKDYTYQANQNVCSISFCLCDYSDLPNNRAANLINFGGKNTYTTLLGPTCLLISEIFPSKPDFHLYKREKILPTRPY